MAVDGIQGRLSRGKRQEEDLEEPMSKHTRFCQSVENEWADAGRDGQTCLVRPNSQARTGTGENSFSRFS